jgi:hypothetical protein
VEAQERSLFDYGRGVDHEQRRIMGSLGEQVR